MKAQNSTMKSQNYHKNSIISQNNTNKKHSNQGISLFMP